MSQLQADAPPGARPTDLSWRTRALDALLPHRGAIANARAAVERDRVAAWQRRQAALVMARATGHPVASRRRAAP
jgi:hypothetical protein